MGDMYVLCDSVFLCLFHLTEPESMLLTAGSPDLCHGPGSVAQSMCAAYIHTFTGGSYGLINYQAIFGVQYAKEMAVN